MYEVESVTFVQDSDIYNVNYVKFNIHIKLANSIQSLNVSGEQTAPCKNMQVCGLLGAIFTVKTMKQRYNGHIAGDIFKIHLLNKDIWISI